MDGQNQLIKINKYLLGAVVFICGAVVMIFELVGSRLLGPYLGGSIYVWTSLIGVILGSMSLGYWLGGKIADKKADFDGLSRIIFFSGIFIVLTIILKDVVPQFLMPSGLRVEISSLASSIILFAPTSILLGMVSPYSVKLRINSLDNSAAVVGNLYAISTLGSILGTFAAGFFIIPFLGSKNILILLFLVLFITSAVVFLFSKKFQAKTMVSVLIIFLLSGGFVWFISQGDSADAFGTGLVFDKDTQYNRVLLLENDWDGKPVRELITDPLSIQSAMFLDSDDLVFPYTKYYHLARYFNPGFKNSLMIGGGAYSFPKDYLKKYTDAKIDVVEIDPGITQIAKEYFKLEDNSRLKNYNEDGRVFLNQTKNKYDAIFGDAFSSAASIPFQLTTKEAVQKQYDILNDNGVVVLNLLSAISGEKGDFLRAEYATFKSVFPQVYLFLPDGPTIQDQMQNIILVALKSNKTFNFKTKDKEISGYLKNLFAGEIKNDMPVLTDDFAPVEYYRYKDI